MLHVATVCSMSGRRKRGAPISYRPPAGMAAEFRMRVLNSGLSVNAFITQAVFGQKAPPTRRSATLDQKMVAQLLSQSARIADKLEEADMFGPAGQQAAVEECRQELIEIRSCLMAALGRSP